jgi:hypothetical protein
MLEVIPILRPALLRLAQTAVVVMRARSASAAQLRKAQQTKRNAPFTP